IGGAAPVGICGSGLVDLLSELLRTGRMNELGRFTDDASTFVVDDAHGLALSEADVNELAQAKGANVAGLPVPLHTPGPSRPGPRSAPSPAAGRPPPARPPPPPRAAPPPPPAAPAPPRRARAPPPPPPPSRGAATPARGGGPAPPPPGTPGRALKAAAGGGEN